MTPSPFATQILVFSALMVGGAGGAASQTATKQETPVELAKVIARTINDNKLKAPGAEIAFESATSHENVVELRFVANDAAALLNLKSGADQTRLIHATFYCNESRITYLKRGIVIHELIATLQNSDRIEFTFDLSTCDSLPKPKLADPSALAEFAVTVAKAEHDNANKRPDLSVRLVEVTSHQGVVDEHSIVLDAAIAARLQANRRQYGAILAGFFCTRYRMFILQGLTIHYFVSLPDGSEVIDFTFGSSSC